METDGTPEGTREIIDIRPSELLWQVPEPGDAFLNPEFIEFDGDFYFAAANGIHGEELWRSDGTAHGTVMVKDINIELVPAHAYLNASELEPEDLVVTHSAEIDNLFATDEWLLFVADDGVHGRELWRSDGTAKGTTLVKDIFPGPQSGIYEEGFRTENHDRAVVFQNVYYFIADDGTHGRELWRSDGTESGTFMLKEIASDENHGFPIATPGPGRWFTNVEPKFREQDGLLYFETIRGQLWQTDGTTEGTQPALSAVQTEPGMLRYGDYAIEFHDGLFYRTHQQTGQREPIAAWTKSEQHQPTWMRIVGDKLVFATDYENSFYYSAFQSLDLNPVSLSGDDYRFELVDEFAIERHATDLAGYNTTNDSSGYMTAYVQLRDFDVPVGPVRALTDDSTFVQFRTGDSITLGFAASVIDGPGNDISIKAQEWYSPEVYAVTRDNQEHLLGSEREFDLSEFDLELPVEAIKIQATALGSYIVLAGATASTDAPYLLTAKAPNNPDLEFSWDLNSDGIFGDRKGRSVGLNNEDLKHFGMSLPGQYSVSVRVNDRVQEYVQSASVEIVANPIPGDVNGDGTVNFSDFLILSDNFNNEQASREQGDLDGDLVVTAADFELLAKNYGLRL